MQPHHLIQIRDLFFRYGLKSMTMDELANQLGCSKKTLYEHYSDKKILVHRVLLGFLDEHREEIKILQMQSRNAIELLIRMAGSGLERLRHLTPTLLFDLQKSYPELWQEMERYRRDEIGRSFKLLIERGQKEGLFRADLDPSVVSLMHLQHTNLMLDPLVLSKLDRPIPQLLRIIQDVFLRGIATPKGLRIWQKTPFPWQQEGDSPQESIPTKELSLK